MPTELLLAEMVVFARVAELGGFSAAARQLGQTPSAVSRQVARLEKALGVQLMVRTTRQLRMTEAGRTAYAHCLTLMTAGQEVMSVSHRFATVPQGKISMSTPKAFGRIVLQPLLMDFMRRYPEIDVQLLVTDRLVDPYVEDVDLIIRVTDQPPQGMVGRSLAPVKQVLCASPTYLDRHGRPAHPDELANHSCLYLGERADDKQWVFVKGEERRTVKVNGRFGCNHSEMRLAAALKGLGIACLPDFTPRELLGPDQLETVLPDWSLLSSWQGAAWLLYPSNRYLAARHRALVEFLVGELGKPQ
ncbi:transcriptional regulator, LysR family [Andreprevotia lacus DSM 23236]|jgi:DNA-binding transcriptional LysR family regulator|uniref:Transcriptional regulator, LysR family n=1 Tax=Andreprevotia lacus DSM 23236 TaxID=1121001 RepID=A0A1W1XFX6_9NEIS|nr:LysR family transcriptional regulator [Andreprevotia lacus]SMC22684.1 transcriptional regulator, LysR family [Andreprevotia lacus DSM 23236]